MSLPPLFSPAGALTAAEMVRRIFAKRHGRRPRAIDVFEGPDGEIFIPNAAELKIQGDHYDHASLALLDALAEGAIIAQVDLDGRRLDVSSTYWQAGVGRDAVVYGRIVFNGNPSKECAPLEGRVFFVEEAKFETWLRRGLKGSDAGSPASARPTASPAAPDDAMTIKEQAYEERVAEFAKKGSWPPLIKTQDGTQGDREWAQAHGVPRAAVESWRKDKVGNRRGRRPNSAGNSAK
jgi:hypothetical protein